MSSTVGLTSGAGSGGIGSDTHSVPHATQSAAIAVEAAKRSFTNGAG